MDNRIFSIPLDLSIFLKPNILKSSGIERHWSGPKAYLCPAQCFRVLAAYPAHHVQPPIRRRPSAAQNISCLLAAAAMALDMQRCSSASASGAASVSAASPSASVSVLATSASAADTHHPYHVHKPSRQHLAPCPVEPLHAHHLYIHVLAWPGPPPLAQVVVVAP